MEEILKKIINQAIHAPSGDNMQPWRFVLKNSSIEIYNVPEADTSLYNFQQRGALLAHGALIENISLIAPTLGFRAQVELLPSKGDQNYIARISFTKEALVEPELFKYIEKRSTNRTKYKDEALTAEQKKYLLENNISEVSLLIADSPQERKAISYAASQGDRMIFENKIVHSFLFEHIRWTDEEELQKKDGLFLKTMELNGPQQAIFKFVKTWRHMTWLNMLEFPRVAVKSNEELYNHGCGFGAIVINSTEPINYLLAGQVLQIFWLKTCSLKMGLQPLSGLPLLKGLLLDNKGSSHLEEAQKKLISKSYEIIKTQFGVEQNKVIAFLFRFGIEKVSSSGRSSRKEPQIKIEV